jgi:hypothetical protein
LGKKMSRQAAMVRVAKGSPGGEERRPATLFSYFFNLTGCTDRSSRSTEY